MMLLEDAITVDETTRRNTEEAWDRHIASVFCAPGATLTVDGYVESLCEFCFNNYVAFVMIDCGGELVPATLTPGAKVDNGHLVLCASCNRTNG